MPRQLDHAHVALVLLWGLVAFGQIKLRKIDGWKDMTKTLKLAWQEAA